MLEVLLWGIAGFWLALLLGVLGLWRYRILLRPSPRGEEANTWPLVSILVPARNEAQRILREVIESLLAQDYPRMEILVVDDRSTDETPKILSEIARRDSRLRVIEGREPPPGWLGKPFALHQALARARGEWILALDADILLHPAAVRTALAFARARGLDALSLLPRFEYVSFWDRVIEPQALNLLRLGMLVAAWKEQTYREEEEGRALVPRERLFHPLALLRAYLSDHAFTIGAFTLLRRQALEDIGGYAAIRGEVLDETILGIRLKQKGYRVMALEGAHLLRTPARGSLRELWEAYSRSICPVMGRSLFRALIGGGILLLLAVFPVFVVVAAGLRALGADLHIEASAIPALVAYGALSLFSLYLGQADRQPLRYGLLAFLGYAVFALIALTAPWRLRWGRGITWRGRYVYDAYSVLTASSRMNSADV